LSGRRGVKTLFKSVPSHLRKTKGVIGSFFKARSPKRFQVRPRHYNPDQEDLQQRVAAIKRDLKAEEGDAYSAEHLRGKLRHKWNTHDRKAQFKKFNMRIAIIATLLFAIVYTYYLYLNT